MCDPVTLLVASTIASMAATTVSTVSQVQQQNYQAAVAEQNASAQRLAARDAQERGRMDSERLGREQAIAKGQQRAAMGANGVDVDFGTAGAVTKDTDLIQSEDRSALQRNIFNEVRGYDMSAANFGNEASAARAAKTGTIFGGALSVASDGLAGLQQYKAAKTGTIFGWNALSVASDGLAGLQQYKGISADRKAGGTGWNVPRRR